MAELSNHEEMRRCFWMDTFTAVLVSDPHLPKRQVNMKDYATECADRALKEYDARFKEPDGF